jgi:hypothetical protein
MWKTRFREVQRYSDSPLKKKTRRRFRGYPIATIAFYGPTTQGQAKLQLQ